MDQSHMTQDQPQHLLSECDLAARWKVSTRTIQRWRAGHLLPEPFKIGRKPLYRLEVILAFETAPPKLEER